MPKTAIALVAFGLVLASSALAANAVRISQVYSGGSSVSSAYKYDYVELFNNSGTPVNIGGWSVQYAAAAGSAFGFSTSDVCVLPAGTSIRPCGYFLVQSGNVGPGGADLPAVDAVMGANMNASAGHIALFPDAVTGRDCAAAQVVAVDLVGYGDAPTTGVDLVAGGPPEDGVPADATEFAVAGIAAIVCYEGAWRTPSLSATTCAVRNGAGMTDTDHNELDFAVESSWSVHNSASPANVACMATAAMSDTWGRIKMLYR
jgi:uncharacterized protein